jgi:hypothetical protein
LGPNRILYMSSEIHSEIFIVVGENL